MNALDDFDDIFFIIFDDSMLYLSGSYAHNISGVETQVVILTEGL